MIPAPRNPPRQLIAGWSDFEVILGLGHGEFGLIEEPRRHGHDFICGIPQSLKPVEVDWHASPGLLGHDFVSGLH